MGGGRIRFIDTELWIRGSDCCGSVQSKASIVPLFFFPSRGPKTDALFSRPQEKVTAAAVLKYLDNRARRV